MPSLSSVPVTGNLLPRALMLAACGYAVFPLQPNKRPHDSAKVAAALGIPEPLDGQGGVKLATRDQAAIRRLWDAMPDAWIGIACGAPSGGLAALDVDRKNGKDGFATLAALGRTPPATVTQDSPSGGRHYLYRAPAGQHAPNDTGDHGIGIGIDRRGDGGYIVDYGGFDPAAVLTAAPDWLLTGYRSPGDRKPLGTFELAAPSLTHAISALNTIDPNDLDRTDWISITSAFKQCTWNHADEPTLRSIWDVWCLSYEKNDRYENDRQWRSIKDTAVGWSTLHWKAYGKPPQPDPSIVFGNRPHALPAGASATPQSPQSRDGYAELISTAPNDLGRNTLVETVKILHGNLPIVFDEFTQMVFATHPLPWDKQSNYPRQWTALDTTHCKLFAELCFVRPSKETVHDAVAVIANYRKQHQVRDYLNGLQWDGVERLPLLAAKYFGAADTPYARMVWTKFMIGAVARVMEPGCKMGNVLILEGKQGVGKSSSIAALAGSDWFTDELPDISSKDAPIQLLGKWFIEVSELSALKKSDTETIKKFMDRSTDRYRAPYDKNAEDHKRQSVFIATTNDESYLRDQTGNRRFWPIACGTIDVAAIQRDRDRLWAEAVARFRSGERWWLNDDENRLAEAEQEERREVDPWEGTITEYADGMNGMPITIEPIFIRLGIMFDRQNSSVTKRIAQCLNKAGYVKKRIRNGDKLSWRYVKL